MSALVRRLSEGSHPVELVIRPDRTLEALRDCLERRYVHIKFTGTQGGTELGVRVDESTYQQGLTAVTSDTGSIQIAGDLVFDYVPVRCVANIDLSTWQGMGHLEVRPSAVLN